MMWVKLRDYCLDRTVYIARHLMSHEERILLLQCVELINLTIDWRILLQQNKVWRLCKFCHRTACCIDGEGQQCIRLPNTMPPSASRLQRQAVIVALKTAIKHVVFRQYPRDWDLTTHIQFQVLRKLDAESLKWTIEEVIP